MRSHCCTLHCHTAPRRTHTQSPPPSENAQRWSGRMGGKGAGVGGWGGGCVVCVLASERKCVCSLIPRRQTNRTRSRFRFTLTLSLNEHAHAHTGIDIDMDGALVRCGSRSTTTTASSWTAWLASTASPRSSAPQPRSRAVFCVCACIRVCVRFHVSHRAAVCVPRASKLCRLDLSHKHLLREMPTAIMRQGKGKRLFAVPCVCIRRVMR